MTSDNPHPDGVGRGRKQLGGGPDRGNTRNGPKKPDGTPGTSRAAAVVRRVGPASAAGGAALHARSEQATPPDPSPAGTGQTGETDQTAPTGQTPRPGADRSTSPAAASTAGSAAASGQPQPGPDTKPKAGDPKSAEATDKGAPDKEGTDKEGTDRAGPDTSKASGNTNGQENSNSQGNSNGPGISNGGMPGMGSSMGKGPDKGNAMGDAVATGAGGHVGLALKGAQAVSGGRLNLQPTKGKVAVGAAAAMVQPAAQLLLLMAILNWLKSFFFALMAMSVNFFSMLMMFAVSVVKGIAGFFSAAGGMISSFSGGLVSGSVASLALGLSMLVAGVGIGGAIADIYAQNAALDDAIADSGRCNEDETPVPINGTESVPVSGNGAGRIASYNVLGATHTKPGGKSYINRPGPVRMRDGLALLDSAGATIAAVQEFDLPMQEVVSKTPGWSFTPPTWDVNAIAYRADVWTLLSIRNYPVPRRNGRALTAQMGTFRDKDNNTISVMTIHNPVDLDGGISQTSWRLKAERIERDAALNTAGPIIVAGDFNTNVRKQGRNPHGNLAPLTDANPAGGPRTAGPVDYIFGKGVTFRGYHKRDARLNGRVISDHPILISDFSGAAAEPPPAGGNPVLVDTVVTEQTTDTCCDIAAVGGINVATAAQTASVRSAHTDANAQAVYSVFSTWGMPKENIAGILGNWSQESGIDATSVEGIFDEPFTIGPRKQAAEASGFSHMGYVDRSGIGLGQWTNSRNQLLIDYASANGVNWYDLGVQLSFMATADNPSDVDVFRGMIRQSLGTPAAAARHFHSQWERSADDASGIAERTADAEYWYAKMSRWTVDQDAADSLIDSSVSAVVSATSTGLASSCSDGVSLTGLTQGGLTEEAAQSLIDVYLREGDAFLDQKYGPNGGPGSCDGDHAMNCVSFSTYFMNKYTTFDRYAPGDGKRTAYSIAELTGRQVSTVPTAYSVFSYATSGYGHTGVVLGIQGDSILIGEAHWCTGRGNIRLVPISRVQAEGWVFVDVSDLVRGGDPAIKAGV